MASDTTKARIGPEIRLFISSSSQSLVSIDMQGVAFDTGAIWEEIDFVRYPFDMAEPKEIVDIYKRFTIDHTKRGRDQRKTGSFTVMFHGSQKALRRYKDTENLIKIQWHLEDVAAVDEYEFFKSARLLNLARTAPEGEVTERIDFIFSSYGVKTGP